MSDILGQQSPFMLICAVVVLQLKIYEDEDGARKEEIAALAQPETGSFAAFYDRLKEVKEYYKRFPTAEVTEVRKQMHAKPPSPSWFSCSKHTSIHACIIPYTIHPCVSATTLDCTHAASG